MRSKQCLRNLSASVGLITIFSTLSIAPASADSLSWTGGVDTDWTRAGNWLNSGGTAHAPQNSDTVDIDNPAAVVIYNNLASPPAAIGGLTVGDTATGNLTVNNALTSTTADIGVGSAANGIVTVSGALGRWNNGDLTVGVAGLGRLDITAAGGYSGTGATVIAVDAHSSGTISVSGGDSYFQTSGPFTIGDAGAGSFEVVTGATASTGDAVLANANGSTGTVTIAGGGSAWTVGDLTVGDGGRGTMTIATGASVTADNVTIGNLLGSDGSSTGLSGSGSSLDVGGALTVGKAGNASLTIYSGATATSASALIGADAEGSATVAGLGSMWTTGDLVVGGDSTMSPAATGQGTLTISSAGAVDSTTATLGDTAGSQGTVTVDGGRSSWDVTNAVTVGKLGSGLVKVTNAATIQSDGGVLGAALGSDGNVLVTGGGSIWTDSGNLIVGDAGNGTLQVTLGGNMSADDTVIGQASTAVGTATVTGNGSLLSTGDLTIGASGDGTLTVADGGAVSADSITIAALAGSTGTLNVGAALGQTAAGAATLDTDAIHFGAGNGTLVFNFGGPAYSLSATIDGDGAIDVASGDVLLTSDSSSFSGLTTVSGGSLSVNGLLGGSLLVDGSGSLSGTGTVGSTTIASGGTISPGSGVGTLTVAGNFTLDGGALYIVDVDAAASDLVQASGTATVSTGAVVSLGDTTGIRAGKTYTILAASQGVTGSFASISSHFAFVDAALGYDANDVTLTLNRNAVAFASVGKTPNQRATAQGIDSLGSSNALYQAVETLSADQARDAFGQLAGTLHAAATAATFDNSRFVRTIGVDRLRTAFGGVGAAGGTVFVLGGPTGNTGESALGYSEKASLSPAAKAAAAILADPYSARAVGWGQAYGGWGRTDGDDNVAGLRNSTGGVIFGADAPFRETTWRLGVMGGYSHGDFDQTDGSGSGNSDNYDIGIYGGNQWGPLALRLGALYERQAISTHRSVDFSGFSENLAADYDAATAQVYGELGYRIEAGKIAFEPFANLAYVHQHSDAFDESGGAAALSSAASNSGVTFTTAGLRSSADFSLAGIGVTARGSLGWRHAFGDTQALSTFHFSGGDDFTTVGTTLDRDSLVLEAGMDFAANATSTIGLTYSGQYGSSSLSQTVKADLAVKF